jgi:hypothetical protein
LPGSGEGPVTLQVSLCLTSKLVAVEVDGERLEDEEIIGFVALWNCRERAMIMTRS